MAKENVKIKSSTDTGRTWDNKKGTIYKFWSIALEDGRTGEMMVDSKKECPLVSGNQYEIDIEEKEYQGNKSLSFRYTPAGSGKGAGRNYLSIEQQLEVQVKIIRQSCLHQAVNTITCDESTRKLFTDKDKLTDAILGLAGKYEEWVNRKQTN